MNPHEKLIAAAQRAARRIARAEGIPYQGALDRVAREAGRRHWQDFCGDPVPVDVQSRQASAEPDFSQADPELHLDVSVRYGLSIGATTMLARPRESGQPTLTYLSADHPEGRGVDARGLSLKAMAASLAHASDPNGRGVYATTGVDLRFQVTSVITQDGRQPSIDVVLDGSSAVDRTPPNAPAEGEHATGRDASSAGVPETLFGIDVPMRRCDDYSRLDLVIGTLVRLPGSHVRVTPRKKRYDVHLVHEGRERLIHHGDLSGFHKMEIMAKDHARIDPMETRIHQNGILVHRAGDVQVPVYVQFEAMHAGMQVMRIALSEHPRLAPFERRQIADPRLDDGMLMGHRGLLRRPVRTWPGRAVLVSGYPGSGKTRDVIVPAILDAGDVDVVVRDRDGRMQALIGDRLARSRTLVLSPGTDGPRFNPLHGDMMPGGHLDAADALADVLYPKHRRDGEYWETGASKLFAGMVDVLMMAPGLVKGPDGRPRPASLPSVMTALRMVEMGVLLSRDSLDEMASRGAHHAYEACRDLLDVSQDTRRSIIHAAKRGLEFLDQPGASSWLTPDGVDDGASLAGLLASGGEPATVVVRTPGDTRGSDVLASLAVDAAVRIREAQGFEARHMHVYLDEFVRMAPMGWTDLILSRSGGPPARISAMITCQALTQIDRVSPTSGAGAMRWFDHVIVTAYSDISERLRLMREFPGIARMAKMAVRIPKGRRQLLSNGRIETLRS
jgi:hypothetical protein